MHQTRTLPSAVSQRISVHKLKLTTDRPRCKAKKIILAVMFRSHLQLLGSVTRVTILQCFSVISYNEHHWFQALDNSHIWTNYFSSDVVVHMKTILGFYFEPHPEAQHNQISTFAVGCAYLALFAPLYTLRAPVTCSFWSILLFSKQLQVLLQSISLFSVHTGLVSNFTFFLVFYRFWCK